jgi:predicted PurR-regulated permease PerM
MIFEGVFTWFMLAYVSQMIGVRPIPMAALLGLITGMLAFIPNIGAIVSGVLMVAVGFSTGSSEGLYAIFVYFFVQNVDGYLVIPYIARRTVDLAPAIVLAMQLLMGALFGILGVLFADPILAALKVMLMDISRDNAAEEGEGAQVVGTENPSGTKGSEPVPVGAAPAVAGRRRGPRRRRT